MSVIIAAVNDGNASVGNGFYRSAMSLIIAAFIDSFAGVSNGL